MRTLPFEEQQALICDKNKGTKQASQSCACVLMYHHRSRGSSPIPLKWVWKKKYKNKFKGENKERSNLEVGEGQVVLFLTWRFQGPDVIGVRYAPQPFVMPSVGLLWRQSYLPLKMMCDNLTHRYADCSWWTCWASISLLGLKKKKMVFIMISIISLPMKLTLK